jgi:hypothetical protein
MQPCPCLPKGFTVFGDQSLCARNVPIRDIANDFGHRAGRQLDPHDRPSLEDVHVRRRVIEGLNPHLEALVPNQRRHGQYTKGLGFCSPEDRVRQRTVASSAMAHKMERFASRSFLEERRNLRAKIEQELRTRDLKRVADLSIFPTPPDDGIVVVGGAKDD